MSLIDYIVLAVVVLILGAAALAIYLSKKKGNACIGCPDSAHCASTNCGTCSCNKK